MKFLALAAALAATTEGIKVEHKAAVNANATQKAQMKSKSKALKEGALYHIISTRNDNGGTYDGSGKWGLTAHDRNDLFRDKRDDNSNFASAHNK